MIVRIELPAGEGVQLNERAFDHLRDQRVRVEVNGRQCPARIVDASVSSAGRFGYIEFDIDDDGYPMVTA